MDKRSKLLAILVAGLVTTSVFVGCGSKDGGSSDDGSASGEKGKLTVWSHWKGNEFDELVKIADAWGEANNVEVTMHEDEGDFQGIIQVAQTANGPDMVLGIPHDNLGTAHKAGILAEVPSEVMGTMTFNSDAILNAVSYDGKNFAVPFAQETSALFVNKDLVATLPTSMEEVVEMGKEVGFAYNINDFYFSQAFLGANGGYVFKNNDGAYDIEDIGLGNEGAIKGLEFINSLVNEDKLMTSDINGDVAKAEFLAGKTGFYISGPWDVADAKEAFNLEVMALPTLDGNAPTPFSGVQTAFVNENSSNKDLAWSLMKEFMAKGQDVMYKTGSRIPVQEGYSVDDPITQAFMKASETAVPMPNIAEVQAMWTPAADNLKLLTSGQIDAKTAGENIVTQMKEGIQQTQ